MPDAPARPLTKRAIAAELTRRKLLDTALDLYSRHKFTEVTIRDIAGAAGVAHGLLSHHFGGKEGLYQAALAEVGQQLIATRETNPDDPAREQLRTMLRAHLGYLEDNRALSIHLILPRNTAGPDSADAFDEIRMTGLRVICELLDIDGDNAAIQLTLRSFSIAADDLILQWLTDRPGFGADALTEAIIAMLAGALNGAADLDPALRLDHLDGVLRAQ
ncbi:TetR/AcrR family transcriptional regulator [Kribbella sandramycini]|uniref:AcrR family transcriptional regulator n=1 Tax=Kribbella sandramycini TaxID=60450 RepID=A0A7Y4KVY5_9ACTN|nr:AcrR family transcriptional regulator [Kribbella sandramycini]NOL39667.1 TetR/AcrR family transcriptional regulator [Kribbella sandramycini]